MLKMNKPASVKYHNVIKAEKMFETFCAILLGHLKVETKSKRLANTVS